MLLSNISFRQTFMLLLTLLFFRLPFQVLAHDHHGPVIAGEVYTEWTTKIVIHAILMLFAIAFCLPYGIILAWRGSHMHKWVQSGTILLVLIAAALALSDVAAEGHAHGQSIHGKLGIITLTLFLFQGLLGWTTKYLKTKIATSSKSIQPQVNSTQVEPSTTDSHPNESHLTRYYSWTSFVHRKLAFTLILLFVPFTALFGLLTATGLIVHGTPESRSDNKNLAAHVGFGGTIALGAIGMFLIGMQQMDSLNSEGSVDQNTRVVKHSINDQNAEGPLWKLSPSNSLLRIEYLVWLVSSVVVIVSQHDWTTPMEYDGMDIQHVMMGIFALVSSICGLTLISLTRSKLRREAASILKQYPHGSVRAYKTTLMSHVVAMRLPSVALYIGLATAMLGHAHGEPYSDDLHFMFAGYCIVYALSKLVGISPWVHILPSETTKFSNGSISGIEGVASRDTSPSDVSRHLSRSSSVSERSLADSSSWRVGSWVHQQEINIKEDSPGNDHVGNAMMIPSAPSHLVGSTTRPNTPPRSQHEESTSSSQGTFIMNWGVTDGVESAGRYHTLSSYLMLTAGITFSGSSKWGLIAASKKLSPVLYIVTLAIISLLIMTWVLVVIEGVLDARSTKASSTPKHSTVSESPTKSFAKILRKSGSSGSSSSRSMKVDYQHLETAIVNDLVGLDENILEMQERL